MKTLKKLLPLALFVLLFSGVAYASSIVPVNQGGTGVSSFTANGIVVSGQTATSSLYTIATTTASCSGSASCSSFTILGSSPVTISASGGGSGSGNVATSSNEVANQIPFFTSNSATPALIGGNNNFVWTGLGVGIGSTTPFTFLDLAATSTNGIGSPLTLFAISSSSQGTATTTLFKVDNTGAVTTAGDINVGEDIYFANDAVPTQRQIYVNDQTNTNVAGNSLYISAGMGNGTPGDGGTLVLSGGQGGSSGNFYSSTVEVVGGSATEGTNNNGGNILIAGGQGDSTGSSNTGGEVDVEGGTGLTTGGLVLIQGGSAASGNNNGGATNIIGGNGRGSGTAGAVTITGGANLVSNNSGTPGAVTITGGSGLDGINKAGANVTIQGGPAGNGSSKGNGGTTIIRQGTKNGTGIHGDILFENGAGTIVGEFASTSGNLSLGNAAGAGVSAIFSVSAISGGNKTFTFPNTTGTFCLLSTCQYTDFTSTPNYGITTSATSTPLWLRASPISLMASSTAWFDQINVGSSTSSSMATSTFFGNIDVKGNIADEGLTLNDLVFDGAGGQLNSYAGTSCTNQFVRSISAAGSATCATVGSGDVSLANLTATDASLTFSGTYNGSTARTIGITAIAANSVLGNSTGASAVPSAVATSSLYTFSPGLSAGTNLLQTVEHHSFTYATSSWSGTTTIPLEVGYGETWNSIQCYTDTGTLNTQIGYGSASTTMFNASTTIGTVTLASNNVMTAGNKVKVDLGTPASSPTKITCTESDKN